MLHLSTETYNNVQVLRFLGRISAKTCPKTIILIKNRPDPLTSGGWGLRQPPEGKGSGGRASPPAAGGRALHPDSRSDK